MKKRTFWKLAFFTLLVVFAAFYVAPYVGKLSFDNLNFQYEPIKESRSEEVVAVEYKFDFDGEILKALDNAHDAAQKFANVELDNWIEEIMARVDDKFLDEYFGFIQTKCREVKTLIQTVKNKLSWSDKTPEDMLAEELEVKISNMVIRPEISDAAIKNIADNAIDVYYSCLDRSFQEIRVAHRIPVPAWNEYISGLTNMTLRAEQAAFKEGVTPLTTKTLVVSGVAVTALAARPVIENIAKSVSAKIAAKTGAKVVEKAGAKAAVEVVAKTGGKAAVRVIPFIGWAVTIGVGIWDVVDYKINASKGKEVLRENIRDYLTEIKAELMGPSSGSIMSSIVLWENDFKERLVNCCGR